VIVYTNKITPRLQYITDLIGKLIIGEPFQLTSDSFYYNDFIGPKINYSNAAINSEELRINNCSLLFEEVIKEQSIDCFETNNYKAFFKADGDYPFDIFAASFYLLSRYEEYLPHKKDEYGRYAHENSLAFKEGFLHLPLVNIWIEDFKQALKIKFPSLPTHRSHFKFQPTYDIDEAFAFRNKGLVKNIGGLARSIIDRQWAMVNKRIKVLTNKARDPYDAYEWMDDLHRKNDLKPLYFFHCAIEKGKYDKNIPPTEKAIQELIKQHAKKYPLGIHPSWKSGDDEKLLEKETAILSSATGKKITTSRQHYIRFTLPHTFNRLIDAGIMHDHSMGYGSINGFRASITTPFYWYDLKKEQQTNLLLHPFCFMEANSFFEQKHLPQRAYEEMMQYYNIVKSVNGTLITIWHNNFLGTHPLFRGWRDVYEEFVSVIKRESSMVNGE
jgi:hypothetical protein